jgi:hypothetical protein
VLLSCVHDLTVRTGNIEYKWKLVGKSPERIAHLVRRRSVHTLLASWICCLLGQVTQMNYRLKEGLGEAIYELGIQDDGFPQG